MPQQTTPFEPSISHINETWIRPDSFTREHCFRSSLRLLEEAEATASGASSTRDQVNAELKIKIADQYRRLAEFGRS